MPWRGENGTDGKTLRPWCRVQPFSSSSVVSWRMTARSTPDARAKEVLADIVAGPKGYVTEEYLARNALILEHLHDPARLFAEARRVLQPGGRLVMTTPNLGALPYLALRLFPKRVAHRMLGRWVQQNLHPEIVGGAGGHPDDHQREGFTLD